MKFINTLHRVAQTSALTILVACGSHAVNAQRTAPTPVQNPAQQDATRPPGTERNQPVPEQARPNTADPTAPPGTQRPSPTAPPGTTLTPQQPSSPTTITVTPGQTATPSSTPALSNPNDPSGVQTTTPNSNDLDLREPTFPTSQSRPTPPLPNITRLGVTGDNILTLTLNEAIRRALQNNNDIEVARNDVRFAETQLRSLLGVYDPIFSITPQINNLVQAQQTTLGGANNTGTVSTTDFQLNPSVVRNFSRGGGNYEAFFNNNRRTTNSTFNQLNPVYSASLGVTFTQPLLRNRSIDFNRREIRIQRKRLAQSDADFRRRTIEVIAQVQNAYWDLVFSLRDQQNRISNLELARQSFRQTEARVTAGALAPLQRAEVQTELSNRESDLLIASQNVSIAENTLKQLILRDPMVSEWSAQVTPTDTPVFDETPVNLTDALAEARANRPELQRLKIQGDISAIDIQYFKNQTRPRIDIQSTIATTGLSGTPVVASGSLTGGVNLPPDTPSGQVPLIFGDPNTSATAFLLQQINLLRGAAGPATVPFVTPQTTSVPPNLVGGYGRTLRNLVGLDTRNIVLGVSIQIPLRNRTAEANLAGAQIQKEQLEASTRSQAQLVEVDVRNSAQAVETSRRRVLSARAARQNAELQLQGEQRLYQVGRSTTFLLFQRENALAGARNLELRAETDYNKSLADLQRATSTTLRANNVTVETPVVP